MAIAKRDNNKISCLMATSSSDGLTTIGIVANSTNHLLCIEDGNSGSDFGPVNAKRDDNGISAIMAVSSADGITPVSIYANQSNGYILVDSGAVTPIVSGNPIGLLLTLTYS
jgi:hypothetical protein